MRYIFIFILISSFVHVATAHTLNSIVQDTVPNNSSLNNTISIGQSRGIAIRNILNNVLYASSDCMDERFSNYYTSRDIYDKAVVHLAVFRHKLLKYNNVDYVPNNISHPNGLFEHLVTIYNYNAKTKQRFIIGQISFEFEEKSKTISKLHFINRSEITDLKALQLKIDSK